MKVLHAAGLAAVLALATPMVASAAGPPAPIDPQNWSFQDNLTWNDYKPLPGTDYANPDVQPTVKKCRRSHAGADAGRSGQLRRVHPGPRQGRLRVDDGQRRLHRP